MSFNVCRCILSSVIVASCVISVSAEMTAITISRGALTMPSVLKDQDVLALSDVVRGEFMEMIAEPPDTALPRYKIEFHMKTVDSTAPNRYVLFIVAEPRSGQVYVYVPGRGEMYNDTNTRITGPKADREGRWHRATRAWAEKLIDKLT